MVDVEKNSKLTQSSASLEEGRLTINKAGNSKSEEKGKKRERKRKQKVLERCADIQGRNCTEAQVILKQSCVVLCVVRLTPFLHVGALLRGVRETLNCPFPRRELTCIII